jgi:hypothetical protein
VFFLISSMSCAHRELILFHEGYIFPFIAILCRFLHNASWCEHIACCGGHPQHCATPVRCVRHLFQMRQRRWPLVLCRGPYLVGRWLGDSSEMYLGTLPEMYLGEAHPPALSMRVPLLSAHGFHFMSVGPAFASSLCRFSAHGRVDGRPGVD